MSTNPLERDYCLGLYSVHKFNDTDYYLRHHLRLYAKQFIPQEDYALVLRRMARDEPTTHLIVHGAKVLADASNFWGSFVLYMPMERLHPELRIPQRPPTWTEKCMSSLHKSPLPGRFPCWGSNHGRRERSNLSP